MESGGHNTSIYLPTFSFAILELWLLVDAKRFLHILRFVLFVFYHTAICNPPCEQGFCYDVNTCHCPEGSAGKTCQISKCTCTNTTLIKRKLVLQGYFLLYKRCINYVFYNIHYKTSYLAFKNYSPTT